MADPKFLDRFNQKWIVNYTTDCWEWIAAKYPGRLREILESRSD